ncbi:MAG: 7TM-DISM domain-containing protein [Bacteroidota bacterium]
MTKNSAQVGIKIGTFSKYSSKDQSQIEAKTLLNKHLELMNSPVPNFGFDSRDVWLRTKIESHSSSKLQLLLAFGNSNLDLVEIHLFDENVLAENFNSWKGNEEQTDDVTLLIL